LTYATNYSHVESVEVVDLVGVSSCYQNA